MSCSLNASAASIHEVPDCLRLGDQALEQLRAALQRAAEALLLVADPAGDRRPLGGQLGIGLGHDLDRALGEAAEPGRLEPERAALLDRPPHDPPQDVAAVLVRGDDAVGDQEGGAARVVGDDPHRPRHRAALAVGAAAELLGEVDQRPDQVGLEDRRRVLQDRRHPVEPHAGVDVAHRQLAEDALGREVVGHEDVVPELEEAVGVVARPLPGAAEALAAVEVELRAGAAGAGRAGLPEVVLAAEQDDPLLGHADALPDLDRLLVGAEAELLVAAEDRRPDLLRVHAEALGRELPAPGDRLGLEVVAEAPVAEHLEEGQVAGGVADLLDVGRAEALLHVGEPRRRRSLAAEEVGLEGLHAGRRQQHRGVVDGGHERGRGDDLVPALGEELEVGVAYLGGLHRPRSLSDEGWLRAKRRSCRGRRSPRRSAGRRPGPGRRRRRARPARAPAPDGRRAPRPRPTPGPASPGSAA